MCEEEVIDIRVLPFYSSEIFFPRCHKSRCSEENKTLALDLLGTICYNYSGFNLPVFLIVVSGGKQSGFSL